MNFPVPTLSTVLLSADDLPAEHGIYIEGEYPWNSGSLCAILPLEDIDLDAETGEERPDFAVKNNLFLALDVNQVQDLVANTQEQRNSAGERVSTQDLVLAFNFYFRNDAFIVF